MFVSTLFIQAVLATVAFAIPTSRERHEQRVARRNGGVRQSLPRPLNTTHPNNAIWAGAVLEAGQGTWNAVTATVTLPTPQEPSGGSGFHSASFWVGIDGANCQSAILQTGIDMNVNGGSVSYEPWYEWYPAPSQDFSGISFSPGDVVTIEVVAQTTTSGFAIIQNHTKGGQTVQKNLTSSTALCESDAEWIVEDYSIDGRAVPFANFGTVQFAGALAQKNGGGFVFPSASPAIETIVQNGQTLTSTSTSGQTVTVSYI